MGADGTRIGGLHWERGTESWGLGCARCWMGGMDRSWEPAVPGWVAADRMRPEVLEPDKWRDRI